MNSLTAKIDRLHDEFADLDLRERLELLLEFADGLAPLPQRLQAEKDAGEHRVHECMTPVFLWIERENGLVQIHADVAPEAPTVKGFVGILADVFSGAPPEEVLSAPPDLVEKLGLTQALGMQRMRGMHAILHRVRAETAKLIG